MVTYDPKLGIYFRTINKGALQYHVQYFGISAVRGWVFTHAVKELRSSDEFTLPERVTKKMQNEFEVAVQETSEALQLDYKQRKLKFIFSFGSQRKGRKDEVKREEKAEDIVKKEVKSEEKREKGRVEKKDARQEERAGKKDGESEEQGERDASGELTVTASRSSELATGTAAKANSLMRVKASSKLIEPGLVKISREPNPFSAMADPSLLNSVHSSAGRPVRRARRSSRLLVADSPLLQSTTPSDHPISNPNTQATVSVPSQEAGVRTSAPVSGTKRPSTADADGGSGELEVHIPLKKAALDFGLDNTSEVSAPSIASAILTPPSSCTEEPPASGFEFEHSQPGEEPKAKLKSSQKKPKVEKAILKSGVCSICDEKDSDLLLCQGLCYHTFHLDCLGIIRVPDGRFVCDECLTTSGQCYACKKSDGDLRKCSKPRCGKLYHPACIEASKLFAFDPKAKDTFACPLHTCARCTSIGLSKSNHSALLQCIKCPLALHKPDCLVAGCEVIDQTHMVCYLHYRIERKASMYKRLNFDTCLECGQPGSLYCCDFCSAAYHADCLDEEDRPQGEVEAWKCPNCAVHDLPTYGSMVVCKFGRWRWWPGEIVQPNAIPDNMVTKKPGPCMFLVRFCGSEDYGWSYHGRMLPYAPDEEEGAKRGRKRYSPKKNGIGVSDIFKRACEEAIQLYRSKMADKEAREQKLQKPESKFFYKIKCNKYLVPHSQLQEDWHSEPCQCTRECPCDDDSVCVNRASHIECDPKTCPVGPLCKNQRMMRCQYASTTPFHTGSRGWGLKASHEIAAGDFVVEYVGEILDTAMCRERLRKAHENNTTNFYMLTLDAGLVIDASQKSNHARFINHSCAPNCETQKWTDMRGETRIGIFAKVDIPAGVEITFDYQLDSLGNEKKRCLCGSKNCSGFLGLKLKTESHKAKPKVDKDKNRGRQKRDEDKPVVRKSHKRKQSLVKKEKERDLEMEMEIENFHEDDCFICKDGGELLMCDRQYCTKSYHLACLSRKKFPSRHTEWECPRHFCQVCQKKSVSFCESCPVSYCKKHNADKFVQTPDLLLCLDSCYRTDPAKETVDSNETRMDTEA